MVLQATVLRLMFAGIKMSGVSTVSPAFTDFSDSNQRHEVSLEGQERIWSSPYLIVDFLPSLYYEQNTEHDTPYYNPIKRSILFRHLRQAICYGEAMKIAGSKYSAQVLVPLAKTLWHGCRHPTRLRATH